MLNTAACYFQRLYGQSFKHVLDTGSATSKTPVARKLLGEMAGVVSSELLMLCLLAEDDAATASVTHMKSARQMLKAFMSTFNKQPLDLTKQIDQLHTHGRIGSAHSLRATGYSVPSVHMST